MDSRWLLFLHLVGMAFWLGGQLFLVLVAVPAMRGTDPEARRALFQKLGRAYGIASLPALALVLGTGVAMMLRLDLNPGEVPALQHKLELVGLILVTTVVHVVAGARGKTRVARTFSIITLLGTLGVVWYATAL